MPGRLPPFQFPTEHVVAFILAAGYGTRLRPLTNHTPKALVEVAGVPMLERVARRCIDAGAQRLVVNVSHLSEQVVAFLEAKDGFGVPFHVSNEVGEPLETGGGIKHAEHLLPPGESLMIHNVDILTDIDFRGMATAHAEARPLATLAVTPQSTDRYLLFDEAGLLGYALPGKEALMRDPTGEQRRLDFCGVQIISSDMVEHIRRVEAEKFSVMDLYLRLAKSAEAIMPFEGAHRCLDIGTHERLAAAEEMIAEFGR